jgi:hypothetical protein
MNITEVEKDAIQYVASWYCDRVTNPYTMLEMLGMIDSGEYNAELMLQHLLLWVSKNTIQ